jgi:hypothetical protein
MGQLLMQSLDDDNDGVHHFFLVMKMSVFPAHHRLLARASLLCKINAFDNLNLPDECSLGRLPFTQNCSLVLHPPLHTFPNNTPQVLCLH